jgi:hypothetical protein
MTLGKETIEAIKKAKATRDDEVAREFTQSLPEATPLAENETMVIFNPPKAKPVKEEDETT